MTINNKTFFFIASIVLIINTNAQRYQSEIFENVTTISNILYSKNTSQPIPTESGSLLPLRSNVKEHETLPVDLQMDIHEPKDDSEQNRPVLILCFGGGFSQGTRTNGDINSLAEAFAKRGYVVAAIDYRLGINVMDSGASQRALYRGVQDSRTAIRFLRANAAVYRINPENIYIIGTSSGGMIALHNIFLDDQERTAGTMATSYRYSPNGFSDFQNFDIPDLGCLDCIGENQEFSGRANGAVAFAGALGSLSFMDDPENKPSLLFHSSDDDQVPFDSGVPYSAGSTQLEKVYGSGAIAEEAELLGVDVILNSFTDRGHDVHTPDGTEIYPDVISEMVTFLSENIDDNGSTLSTNHIEKKRDKDFIIFPNPTKKNPKYI